MRNFLVPVDFTEITNPLLKLAKIIAKAHQAKITLMHVIPPVLYPPSPFGVSVIDLEFIEELEKKKEEEAKEKLLAFVEFLKPLEVDLLVEVGDPAELILEKEENFDLVIMASHKKGLVERVLVGSTAEKVARYSKRPLLILKGREVSEFKKVVIAHDLSEYANRAFEFALRLLKPFLPKIVILHVEESIELPIVANIKDVVSERYKEEKRRYLNSLVERANREGFTAELIIKQAGSPSEAILESVKEDTELLVMGSRGLSTFQRVILGSTSSEVLRRVDCPILIHREL